MIAVSAALLGNVQHRTGTPSRVTAMTARGQTSAHVPGVPEGSLALLDPTAGPVIVDRVLQVGQL